MLDKLECGTATGADLINRANGSLGVFGESIPSGFNWPQGLPDVEAYKSGNSYYSNVKPGDFIDFSVFTNALYVDINMPDSSGDGLSWATAEKGIGQAIDTAIASGLPTRILVRGGIYPRAYSVGNANLKKNLTAPVCIEAVYGRVITGTFDDLTYTKTTGRNNVYESARSNAVCAFDPRVDTTNFHNKTYAKVNSVAECDSTPGSFYTDNVSVYVHTFNSTPANNKNTRITLNAIGASFGGNHDIYVYGFEFLGGNNGAFSANNGSGNSVVVNKCKAMYAALGSWPSSITPKDGFQINGCSVFCAFDSEASFNSKDGFNLHDEGAVKPSMITVNCSGFDNGKVTGAAASCNGVTVHDGLSAIDIGGIWLGSVGTNAGHVDNDTHVWHFGSVAGNSDGDIYNGGSINYGGFGAWSGTAKLWLSNCTDEGCRVGVLASGGAEIFTRNHSGTGLIYGNVSTY